MHAFIHAHIHTHAHTYMVQEEVEEDAYSQDEFLMDGGLSPHDDEIEEFEQDAGNDPFIYVCMCMHMYVYVYLCVCVCAYIQTGTVCMHALNILTHNRTNNRRP